MGVNSANTEQELEQRTALRKRGSLDCSGPLLTSSVIAGG